MIESKLKPGQYAVAFVDPLKRSGPCIVVWLHSLRGFFQYDENRHLEVWTTSLSLGEKGVIRLINPTDGVVRPEAAEDKRKEMPQ